MCYKMYILSNKEIEIEYYQDLSVTKRQKTLNGHLSIGDSTLNFCQKGSCLRISRPSKE